MKSAKSRVNRTAAPTPMPIFAPGLREGDEELAVLLSELPGLREGKAEADAEAELEARRAIVGLGEAVMMTVVAGTEPDDIITVLATGPAVCVEASVLGGWAAVICEFEGRDGELVLCCEGVADDAGPMEAAVGEG